MNKAKRRHSFRRLLLVAILTLLTTRARPTTAAMIEVSPAALRQRCELMVLGTVKRVESRWNSAHTMIFTDTTIAVQDWFKGDRRPAELVVRTLGGTVGAKTCQVSDQPEFKVNRTVLLFLEPEPQEAGVWKVSGSYQGQYAVRGGRIVENGLPVDDFVRRTAGGVGASIKRRGAVVRNGRSGQARWWYNGKKWPDTAMPIGYYMNSNGLNDCIFDEFAAVERAGHAWEQVPGAYFSLCYRGTTGISGFAEDGKNVISWVVLGGNTLGMASWWSTNGVIYETDMELNTNKSWYAFAGDFCQPLKFDVESVATHEFGHWLSLGHSNVAGATMKPGLPTGSTIQRFPAADDMNGIRRIYPHPDGVPKPQPGCWDWLPPNPVVMTFGSYSQGDVDRDGVDEIVVGIGGTSQGVWALNGDATPDRENGLGTGDIADSVPAVGDVDADGWPETAVGSTDGKVYLRNHDGTAVAGWPIATGGEVHSSPAIGDIDGDGALEIVVGTDASAVYAWNANGTVVDDGTLPCCDWPQVTGDKVRSSPALGDIDSNGSLDIVVGCDDGNVYAWDYTGTDLPGWPQATGDWVRSTPALGDIDGDGQLEVVVGSVDGNVYAWNADGTPVDRDGMSPWDWPQATGSAVESSPALVDLDGDGSLDVVVGSNDWNVYAWDYTGTALPGWPATATSPANLSPIVGDMDGDDELEVIAPAGARLHAWNADGTAVAGWPMDILGFTGSPALGDFDGNGELEISFGSGGGLGFGVRCFDLGSPYDPDLLPWPVFGHDRYHSSLSGFQPDPIPPLPYSDPFDPDWTVRLWGSASQGVPQPGYNGFVYVSPPYSFEVTGSATPGDYAWAQSTDVRVDFTLPYRLSFYLTYQNFYQTRFLEFGHIRLFLDSPTAPLFYDAVGDETFVPLGPPVSSYLSGLSWNFFEIDVDPMVGQYTILVNSFPVGTASYSGSFVPGAALYMEDGAAAGSLLEATYDDMMVEGSMSSPCVLPGDSDCDRDVDLNDLLRFADCFAGPGVAPSPPAPMTAAECLHNFDSDGDGDVDLDDFASFQMGFWPTP